jgi:hypothetical protein
MSRSFAEVVLILALASGCDRSTPPGTGSGPAPDAAQPPPPTVAEQSGEKRLRPPPPLNTTPPPFKLGASHVLIQYEGATRSKATRTKEEARALATDVLARAKKGESFADLARELSDDPGKADGGDLGAFELERMVAPFSNAVSKVEPGEFVPEVVETEFGFHVIRREPLMHLGHVLVQFKEAHFVHAGIKRTQQEAREEIERVAALLHEKGADFGQIAAEHSDCMLTKAVGGDLGYYGKNARLLPAMLEASTKLQPGEVSAIFETDYGFHIMWRFADGVRPGGRPEAGRDAGPDGQGARQ